MKEGGGIYHFNFLLGGLPSRPSGRWYPPTPGVAESGLKMTEGTDCPLLSEATAGYEVL